jgi:hypothetical protein
MLAALAVEAPAFDCMSMALGCPAPLCPSPSFRPLMTVRHARIGKTFTLSSTTIVNANRRRHSSEANAHGNRPEFRLEFQKCAVSAAELCTASNFVRRTSKTRLHTKKKKNQRCHAFEKHRHLDAVAIALPSVEEMKR